jgi:hypothetical protein
MVSNGGADGVLDGHCRRQPGEPTAPIATAPSQVYCGFRRSMESSWFIESTHRRLVSLSASADIRAAWSLP